MGTASGEEVSPDVIAAYNRKDTTELNRILHAGISDQRVALIKNILARRSSGANPIPATTKGAAPYAEARSVSEFTQYYKNARGETAAFQGNSNKGVIMDSQGHIIGSTTRELFASQPAKTKSLPIFNVPKSPSNALLLAIQNAAAKNIKSTSAPEKTSLGFVKGSGEITLPKRQKGGAVSEVLGLGNLSAYLRAQSDKNLRQRGEGKFTSNIAEMGLGAATGIIDFLIGIFDLPETAYRVFSNPKILLDLPNILKKQGAEFGVFARENPNNAVGYVGGQLIAAQGSAKVIDKLIDLSKSQMARLSTKYLGDADTGDVIRIPFKTETGTTETIRLKIVGEIPRETIQRQLARAGKKLDYAVSSQAENLLGAIRRGKIVRKPIPGEEGFNSVTKSLLKKFDSGSINRRELIRLDQLIRRSGSKGILERAFFASPGGEVRPSRLGILKENRASLSEVLSGDVKFKRPKPQVLVFKNLDIEDFPKSLRNIIKKIKAGKKLTDQESGRLLEYQLTKSGKFKTPGFITGEKEINLAPGELIRRKKIIGRTVIKGKAVPIIEAEVFSPSGELKTLLKKLEKGALKDREFSRLDKLLKKESGLDYGLSSAGKKYFNVKGYAAGISSQPLKSISKKVYYTGSGKPYIKTSKGSRFISPSQVSSSGKYTGSSKPKSGYSFKTGSGTSSPKKSKYAGSSMGKSGSGTSGGPPIGPPIVPIGPPIRGLGNKKARIKKEKEGIEGYHVYGKSRGKWFKITRIPLSWYDAQSRGAYAVDNTTSKQFVVTPAGKVKKLGQLKQWERGYINKTSYKFRAYKIRKGRAVAFKKERLLEKRRFGIDTKGEKRQLSLARYIKKLRGGINAASFPRGSNPTTKYKYINTGMFGERRRIQVRPRKIIKRISKIKPKYKYINTGMFGERRKILIKPRLKKPSPQKQRFRIIPGGMFGPSRRVPIRSRRPKSVISHPKRFKYVNTGMFGERRRIQVRPKRIKLKRNSVKKISRQKQKYRYINVGIFGERKRIPIKSHKKISIKRKKSPHKKRWRGFLGA